MVSGLVCLFSAMAAALVGAVGEGAGEGAVGLALERAFRWRRDRDVSAGEVAACAALVGPERAAEAAHAARALVASAVRAAAREPYAARACLPPELREADGAERLSHALARRVPAWSEAALEQRPGLAALEGARVHVGRKVAASEVTRHAAPVAMMQLTVRRAAGARDDVTLELSRETLHVLHAELLRAQLVLRGLSSRAGRTALRGRGDDQ